MTHMRAIFIRHGESTGNACVPCHDLAAIELTERVHEQARQIAAIWTQAPARIVTSPYPRTRQTAAPTIARFPGVVIQSVMEAKRVSIRVDTGGRRIINKKVRF